MGFNSGFKGLKGLQPVKDIKFLAQSVIAGEILE